jgi:general secretion pathway protein I
VNEIQNSEAGFTLVEILAALAILTLSLSALFGVLSDGIGRAGQAEAHAQAGSLAQSLLARVGAEISIRQGATAGEFAEGYRWRLRIEPYGDAADNRAWPIAAYSVSAEVTWGAGAQERSIVLTTLRVMPKEPAR